MKKLYEHQYVIIFNGDTLGNVKLVRIKSNNKIIHKDLFLSEVNKLGMNRYDFFIHSYCIFTID